MSARRWWPGEGSSIALPIGAYLRATTALQDFKQMSADGTGIARVLASAGLLGGP